MTFRDTWRAKVLRDRRINNATRCILIVLCDHMDGDGQVSVPRSRLAQILGLQPTRITEGLAAAHAAGLLATLIKGKPGTTARYVARVSDGAPVRTKRRASRGAPVRTKHMVGIQYQAEVRPYVPSETPAVDDSHAQHGAPVGSASSTKPQQPTSQVSTVVGQTQQRSDEQNRTPLTAIVNAFGVGYCQGAGCGSFEKLGPDGLCSACCVAAAVAP